MNLFCSMMCHLGIVIGPSTLFALRMIKYSVYPSHISLPASNTPSVRYGKFQSSFCNIMTHNLTLCALVPSLMFLGLTVLDSLNPVFVVPCVLSQGIIVSCAYYNTQFLTAPLWITRQLYILGVMGILASFCMAYKIMSNGIQMDENRKVLLGMQK